MVEEITKVACFERFADEWVCLDVLEEDAAGQTRRGRVIAHSADKSDVLYAECVFRAQHSGHTTLVFFAGPVVDPAFDGAVIL